MHAAGLPGVTECTLLGCQELLNARCWVAREKFNYCCCTLHKSIRAISLRCQLHNLYIPYLAAIVNCTPVGSATVSFKLLATVS